jgi:uncharacterized protein (TIGR02266 family)
MDRRSTGVAGQNSDLEQCRLTQPAVEVMFRSLSPCQGLPFLAPPPAVGAEQVDLRKVFSGDRRLRFPLASMPNRLPSIPGSPYLERRQIARYEVSTEITFTSDNNFYSGFTENLSAGGLFVTSDKALPDIGTLVELTWRVPGADADLRCTGEVRWHGTTQHGRRGYGVRFVSLSPEAESLIQNFIQHRKPLVHTGT